MDEKRIQELLDEKKWIVEDIIGKGRYGVVVKARERLTNTHFAIKVVEYTSEDQRKYRKRELGLLAMNASKHKDNVMQYYHAWTKGDIADNMFLFIKMELCYRGLDVYMKEMSREESQAGASTCISIVKDANLYKTVFPQILNGLVSIHSLKPKWVHRDISLANILVQLPIPKSIREIQIKIGDFGLARELPTEAGDHLTSLAKLHAIWQDSERTLYQAGIHLTTRAELDAKWQDSERTLYQAGIHLTTRAELDAIWQDSERTPYQAPELSEQSYCEKVDMYSAGIILYLLVSYPDNQNQWPSDVEIQALRDGKRGRSNLCHDDEVLAELLFSPKGNLLHKDPEKRPSARQALCKLPLQRNISIEDCDKEGEIFLEATIGLLSEKFTLINKSLGSGSYGTVISVQHRIDKRQYAVKIIRRKDVPEKYQKRELDILTKQVDSPISHNNIVRYYDSWEAIVNGTSVLYIQMELCKKSLRAVLQENRRIVDQDILHKHVFAQILLALIFIHDSGFVHRDIYPPNILISTFCEKSISTWVVKLADFGFARIIDRPSRSDSDQHEEKLSSKAGNRFYRAPEMWKGTDYGKKVDIYSAGVVLYRLSCYLENDEKIENALSKLQEKTVDRNILSVGGDRLFSLLNRLVEKNPEKRPDAREAERMFKEYIRNGNSLPEVPSVDVLSLDEANRASQEPTQGVHVSTRPVANIESVDETDSISRRPDTHIAATGPVELEEDDDDEFKDGLC